MQEWLIGLGVMLLVWLVRVWIQSIRARKKASKTVQPSRKRELDYARTKTLFNMALCKLIQKGHGDLMMTDYHIKTKVDPPKTTDIDLLGRQLQSVLMEILTHLHLMPNVRLVLTKDPKKLVNQGAMGEYDGMNTDKKIRLLIAPEYSANDVVFALCHECAHYFAYSCGIAELDKNVNEGLTDTLTVLFGFSEAALNSNNDRAFPYLNGAEFQEMKRLLAQYREGQKTKRAEAQDIATARAQLRKNVAGAREMIRHAQAMISVKNTSSYGKKLSRSELADLQQILLAFESGSFLDTLSRAEKAVNGSLRQVRQADDGVLDVCAKIYKLMLAFQ
ncbi:MAG: hypothetical protein IKG32_06820 [Clostridia bacterium]|nr:hypothetical protein [Clostridia bacterium]